MASFPSVRIEGGLLSSDLLDELFAGELKGQKAADFGLDAKRIGRRAAVVLHQ